MSTNTALDQIKARVEGHTEGPWEIEAGDEAWEVRAPEGSITWDDHGGEVFRNQADAELIAAAPKLLAALEAVEALLAEKYKLWAAVCGETCVKDHFGIDHEAIADNIATNIRSAIEEALR